MKHASNQCCRMLLRDPITPLPALQIRVSEEINEKDVRAKRTGKMNRTKKQSPPYTPHSHAEPAMDEGEQHHEKTKEKLESRARRSEGSGRSSDLCAGRRRRNSLSLLCCVGRKGSSGRTAGSSGGRRGEDGIAAEPENPENSAEKRISRSGGWGLK